MSDDLVTRLRDASANETMLPKHHTNKNLILWEAADRIEQLEAEVAKWKESVDMATMLGESLAAEVKRLTAAAHDKGGM